MLREEILLCILIAAKPVGLIIFTLCAPILRHQSARRAYRRYR